jgi:hypothetical protein
VVPQGLFVFLPFFFFGDFRSLFLGISVGKFWGRFFEGFLLDVTYEDLVPLWLVILLQQTLRNQFGSFRWFLWEGVLEG